MSDVTKRATMSPASCLEVRGVTVIARATGKILVEDVSFDLRGGEALAMVGESGSGKSLTALATLGLLSSSVQLVAGSVWLDGKDITGLQGTAAAFRGRELAMIFQDPQSSLDPRWTVGRYLARQIRRLQGIRSSAKIAETTQALLESVGLTNPDRIMRSYPHELSGGMAQRVMIAGALAGNPHFLLADEPTTALDVTTQAQILDLLAELCSERGLGLLMITHDLGVVADTSDHVMVLYGGRIMETGTTRKVLNSPAHPYTRALLAAMPDIDSPLPPRSIPGTPGRPADDACCPFHLRCEHAFNRCRSESPAFTPHGDGGLACHLDGSISRAIMEEIKERADA